MKIKLKFDKKNRYFIFALVTTFFIYMVSNEIVSLPVGGGMLLWAVFILVGVMISHYPNLSTKGLFFASVLPFSLVSGYLLSSYYFPNISMLFKIISYAGFFGLYYLVLLIDNIFLVVKDREDTIPLYRVALTWSQIVQVMVAIPLFSGIFKININGMLQSLIVAIISFIFCLYQIWAQHFDEESKRFRVGEILILCLICTFIVFTISVAIIFIPTESFLRALMVSTGLLFGLVYVAGYLKNKINKQMMFSYSVFILLFFIILLIFQP